MSLAPTLSRPIDHETSSADLHAALRRQCPTAWRTVVSRHQSLLLRITRQCGMTPEESADVVQETWIRLLLNVERIDDPDRLAGWLATTARRLCFESHRRRQREIPSPDEALDQAETVDLDEMLDAVRRCAQLREAVTALPRRERELVELLLEPDPPSYAQISRRLHMPIGSIGPVRGRALRRLRALLDHETTRTTTTLTLKEAA